MDILFLGTSSGTPTSTRNVSGIAVQESQGKNWYLIDCGEGTQHQIQRTPLSLATLQAILITHVHGDHCYGLPGLLASAGMNHRTAPLTIIAPAGIKEWFEATQQHTQLYLPFALEFVATETLKPMPLGQFNVAAIELSHRVPSYAYQFTEVASHTKLDINKLKAAGIPQGPLWGQLNNGKDIEFDGQCFKSADFAEVDHQPRNIIICGDNDTPEKLKAASENCHVLVHEATYTKDIADKAGDVGHSYAEQVARFAEDQALPNLILTHFSARYQPSPSAPSSIEHIRQEAQACYSGNLFLAEDFERYRLDKSGGFSMVHSDI
jgi:ribonuclease Z